MSVLLRKPRAYAEVYNDLDGEVVNLFRVLRNPSQARELIRSVYLTPYSRQEFDESYIVSGDTVEQARRTLFRSAAGFSSVGASNHKWKTGFRGNVTRSGTTPARDWTGIPDVLEQVVERLRGVVIENDTALAVIERYDGPETVFYLDPPYVFSTRPARHAGGCYQYEMTDQEHQELAEALHEIEGMALLSGYRCDLYDELYQDWRRVDKETHADRALDRTESLWLSPLAAEAQEQESIIQMEMEL
jgi:DNA adenine methylase